MFGHVVGVGAGKLRGLPVNIPHIKNGDLGDGLFHWIGLRENLQESPIFNGKIYGFL
jgi:hypothetical protein